MSLWGCGNRSVGTMHIAIVDDHKDTRDQIEGIVYQYYKDKKKIEITCEQFANGEIFLEAFKKSHFQIVFLDIEMPGKNGIEIKDMLEMKENTYILFMTGYGEFMQSAFGKNVCGFLEKPVDEEKITYYLDKIEDYQAIEQNIYLEDIQKVVKLKEIRYIKAENQYSHLHMDNGEVIIARKNLGTLEKEIESYGFFRTHRSYIVNFRYVKIIKKEVILYDGTKIKIARGKHACVKTEFWSYMDKNGRCI